LLILNFVSSYHYLIFCFTANEETTAAKIAEVMIRVQQLNCTAHRHGFRATHVKTQGIVKDTLHINDDLPEHLRQGMFASPGKDCPL
jgi:hypothetical protein